MLRENLALLCSAQQGTVGFRHVWVAREPANDCVISTVSREANQIFPLYLYPEAEEIGVTKSAAELQVTPWPVGKQGRWPNFAPSFVKKMEEALGLQFNPTGPGDLEMHFRPEDVFSYMYAIFWSAAYRERYSEFLKRDFPSIPITSERRVFRALAEKGSGLVALHVMESPLLDKSLVSFPVPGSNEITSVRYSELEQRVWINTTQYFEGVERNIWSFRVGAYDVLEKWLKDRKGRNLSYADVAHYQKIAIAVKETLRLMADIDSTIPDWPIR